MTDDAGDSILAMVAGWLVPLMKPVGLGDWRICVSLFTGFLAKESVVSTLEILFGSDVQGAMTSLSAAALLVFSLLYTPCAAAIAAVKRELGSKWAVFVVVFQCAAAWFGALLVHLIGTLIGV